MAPYCVPRRPAMTCPVCQLPIFQRLRTVTPHEICPAKGTASFSLPAFDSSRFRTHTVNDGLTKPATVIFPDKRPVKQAGARLNIWMELKYKSKGCFVKNYTGAFDSHKLVMCTFVGDFIRFILSLHSSA